MAVVCANRIIPNLNRFGLTLSCINNRNQQRRISKINNEPGIKPEFGILFDIDGVIVRGRQTLPRAKDAFRLLTDENKEFWVPTVFVTNAGSALRQAKAAQLSKWVNAEVTENQVVMSHSPLKLFTQLFHKHVLVTGQGPVREIARNLGFQRITTIETLRQAFPNLDMVDHSRRRAAPCAFEKYFPPIEAIILFGEPIRWETNLQLIVDVLLTNGRPDKAPERLPDPHIPVLACNTDLQWMAEACMPRLAHGSFLLCLESLYKKISGMDLKYTSLIGKPNEITFHHSECVLQEEAQKIGIDKSLRRIYFVGDNPDVDVYGANLYNRLISLRRQGQKRVAGGEDVIEGDDKWVDECNSVLVCTGVYNDMRDYYSQRELSYAHRDYTADPMLRKPKMVAVDVYEAVHMILKKEGLL